MNRASFRNFANVSAVVASAERLRCIEAEGAHKKSDSTLVTVNVWIREQKCKQKLKRCNDFHGELTMKRNHHEEPKLLNASNRILAENSRI